MYSFMKRGDAISCENPYERIHKMNHPMNGVMNKSEQLTYKGFLSYLEQDEERCANPN